MNRDDIIRMARKAGFANVKGGIMDNGELSDYWDCWPDQLMRFAALVAAAEREACARVCEEVTAAWTQHVYNEGVMDCVKAIRARGEV